MSSTKDVIRNTLQNHPFLLKIIEDGYGYVVNGVPSSLRYGPEYKQMLSFLEKSQSWSHEEHQQFQYEKLLDLLQFAEKNIPWYQRIFSEWGVSSKQFVNLADIKKYPTVSKEDIRDHLNHFINPAVPHTKLIYITTGGSTGIPFGFYQTQSVLNLERAFFAYHWGWFQCGIHDLSAVLRGGYIGTSEKFYSYKPVENAWHFSSYYMSEDKLPLYVKKLNHLRPRYIQAYPSAVEILAKYILDQKIQLDFIPNTIMCGSENLYPAQRELIEKAFQTHVHCWYGQAEKVCLAPWTQNSRLYHVLPQYGYTELIDPNGAEVDEEGRVGEIVATSFYNYSMPFIRYRTRDLAVHTSQQSPEGFNYRLFSRIEGRLQELFVTATGRLISMTAINMHDDIFDRVSQFQFYQDTPGKLLLNIVPKKSYSDQDTKDITRRLKVKLGNDTQLSVQIVNEIPRTPNGKLRFLIQKLPIHKWEAVETLNN